MAVKTIEVWNIGRKDILLRGGVLSPGVSAVLTVQEFKAMQGLPALSKSPPAPPTQVPRKKTPSPPPAPVEEAKPEPKPAAKKKAAPKGKPSKPRKKQADKEA